MNAIIVSVGDELVLGQTVDTNSAWLSAELAAVGCGVSEHMTVADDQIAIERAVRRAVGECDVLLISGGLGPTEDDLTRQALAAVMGVELLENAGWIAELEQFFSARGRPMPTANRIQAMIPRGATMIFNACGTASGIEAEMEGSGFRVQGSGTERTEYQTTSLSPEPRTPNPSCHLFVMPGVPKEMKVMFARDVLPKLRTAGGGGVILSRTLHTFGLGESAVAERLGTLMRRGQNPSVGTTVANGVVSLRVNARFGSADEARRELEQTAGQCRAALGELVYGEDGQTLSEIVAALLKRDAATLTVTTAESCTGGLLAKMLTDIPGSSAYFHRGWITYSNQAKHELLGVPAELIAQHGAVSEPVVRAMADGARERAGADYALSISGIAGPDGGTPEKPVGTTWVGLAKPNGIAARRFVFPGDREFIRDRAAKMALTLLRFELLGQRTPF